MKVKKTTLIATIIAIIFLIIASIAIRNELLPKYIPERDGEIWEVNYSPLNLHLEPGEKSEVITTVKSGDQVKLTGNFKTMSIGSPVDDIWAEVIVKVDSEGKNITGEDVEIKEGDQFTYYVGWVTINGIEN